MKSLDFLSVRASIKRSGSRLTRIRTRSKRQCRSDGRSGDACPDRRHRAGSGSLLLVSHPAFDAERRRFRGDRRRHERNRELQRRGKSGSSEIWLCWTANNISVTASNTAPCPSGGATCYSATITGYVPLFLSQVVGYTRHRDRGRIRNKQCSARRLLRGSI